MEPIKWLVQVHKQCEHLWLNPVMPWGVKRKCYLPFIFCFFSAISSKIEMTVFSLYWETLASVTTKETQRCWEAKLQQGSLKGRTAGRWAEDWRTEGPSQRTALGLALNPSAQWGLKVESEPRKMSPHHGGWKVTPTGGEDRPWKEPVSRTAFPMGPSAVRMTWLYSAWEWSYFWWDILCPLL